MQPDAFRQIADADAPETAQCAVYRGTAERLSSAWQGEGIAYHNYRYRTDRYLTAGTIIEYKNGEHHHVGPIFGDPDLAVHLATRDHPDVSAEAREVHT